MQLENSTSAIINLKHGCAHQLRVEMPRLRKVPAVVRGRLTAVNDEVLDVAVAAARIEERLNTNGEAQRRAGCKA
jgi:hypothetical protein